MRRLCFAFVVCVCASGRDSKGIYIHPNVFVGRGNSRRASLNCIPPLLFTLVSDALLITLSHCLRCHFALHFHSPIISRKQKLMNIHVCMHRWGRGGAVNACGGGEGGRYGVADAMSKNIATGCHLIILRNH